MPNELFIDITVHVKKGHRWRYPFGGWLIWLGAKVAGAKVELEVSEKKVD